MTVSTEAGEFDNAVNSVARYSDPAKSDFAQLLGVSQEHSFGVASVSGCQEADYPTVPARDAVPVLSEAQRVPLPAELIEQFSHMQVDWRMGIFTKIGRAWLTIDADIFIWKYQTGEDLAYFDGLSETILAVTLVKPVGGIFRAQIRYLLVVATAVEIILLGVCFTNNSTDDELNIIPEPLFTVSTEGIQFQNIIGTEDGRIFLAGKDGCLHEVIYSLDQGWFGRRCRRINLSSSKLNFLLPTMVQNALWEDDPLAHLAIDNKRNILWTASEKGSLSLYDLGVDGKGVTKVSSLSISQIISSASRAAPQLDKSNFAPIITVSIIDSGTSRILHLVAVTASGIRLYFTAGSSCRPSTVQLSHIRLPPGFTSSTVELKPRKVHTGLVSGQVSILCSEENGTDYDYMWSLVSMGGTSNLPEEYGVSKLDGRVWCCAAIDDEVDPLVPTDPEGAINGLSPSRDVCSVYQSPSEFVLMTKQGTAIYRSLSSAQQLLQMLKNSGGMETPDLERFMMSRDSTSEGTTCCIQLACDPSIDQQTARWATLAYFRYGGAPSHGNTAQPLGQSVASPLSTNRRPEISQFFSPIASRQGTTGSSRNFIASTPMPSQTLQRPASESALPQPNLNSTQIITNSSNRPGGLTNVSNSARYRGLAKYLSRLLRPVWNNTIVVKIDETKGAKQMPFTSRLSFDNLGRILNALLNLKVWMEQNSIGTSPVAVTSTVDVGSFENSQFNSQYGLLTRAQEVIALWQLLADNQLHVIATSLESTEKEQLSQISVRDLVTTEVGRNMCQRLITAVVSCYLDDNASVESLSYKLREICPTLFSADDAVCSKATEILSVARHSNPQDSRTKCEESLRLFIQIARTVNLSAVTTQFAAVKFWEGVVALTLAAVEKRDPAGLALHHFKNGCPMDDNEGQRSYQERSNCYEACLVIIKDLVEQAKRSPASPSLPSSPGEKPKQSQTSDLVLAEEARIAAEEMLQKIISSEDELFHISVYNWLMQSEMTDRLLNIQSAFLESYLIKTAANQPENITASNMLWKYYEKVSLHGAAARVLLSLAENSPGLKLAERLEYLSRAVIDAAAILSPTAADEQLHREVQEKVEVAGIQQLIQHQTRDNLLDDRLFDLNKLYQDYADPLDLPEAKLAIVHCAGQYDESAIEGFWQEIIEKEVEATKEMTQEAQLAALRSKILSMGKRYSPSGRFLPIFFVTQFLEKVSCYMGWPQRGWIIQLLLDIGVPLIHILVTYDQIYQARDDFWEQVEQPLHLITIEKVIFELFLEKPTIVPANERRLFVDKSLQILASSMVTLGAMSSNTAELTSIMHGLKQVQYKLERWLQ